LHSYSPCPYAYPFIILVLGAKTSDHIIHPYKPPVIWGMAIRHSTITWGDRIFATHVALPSACCAAMKNPTDNTLLTLRPLHRLIGYVGTAGGLAVNVSTV